jgi:hypothetical protein
MDRRAQPSGITLNEACPALVKGMLCSGDRQHDIAARFGEAEIAVRARFNGVSATDIISLAFCVAFRLSPESPAQHGCTAGSRRCLIEKCPSCTGESGALSTGRGRCIIASAGRGPHPHHGLPA